jgi:hypothetical protein
VLDSASISSRGRAVSEGTVRAPSSGMSISRVVAALRSTAGSMQPWTGWSADAGSDHAFRIVGACPVTIVSEDP